MSKQQIQTFLQSYFPPRTTDPTPNKNLANFYTSYFNGAYFLGISPFRLKLVEVQSHGGNNNNMNHTSISAPPPHFTAVTWLPQKLFCLVLLILHLFWMARDIRVSLPKDAKNPSMYFLMIHTAFSAIWKLATIKYFWFNQKDFLKLLNFIIDPDNSVPVTPYPSSSSASISNYYKKWTSRFGGLSRSNVILVYAIMLIYSGVGIGYWIAGKGVLSFTSDKVESWSVDWWWGTMKETGSLIFFCHDTNNTDSAWNNVLGVMASGSAYHRRVLPLYCYYFGMVTVLTLRSSVIAFTSAFVEALSDLETERESQIFKSATSTKLSKNNKHIVINMNDLHMPKWDLTRRQYWALKTLANLINQPFGTCFTLYLVKSIVYYAITFDEVFVDATPKWSKIALLLVYFCNACFVMYFSSDICFQMSKFKEWLSIQNNRQRLPSDELYVIMNEVDFNVVAIRAGNVFPITHSLVANIVGVTVTYFIICVQT